MSKKEIQRENSIQKIVEGAMALFSEQGYDGTSIRQIALKAGISLGLLYNYFPSKEELLKAGLEKGRRPIEEAFVSGEGLSPYQQVEQYAKATLRIVEENQAYWRLYYSLRLQSEVVKNWEQERQAENQKFLASLSRKLADAGSTSPTAEARLLQASLDGIAQQFLASPDFPLPDVLIRFLLQLKNHLGTPS